jgi:hypothetical protein
MGHTRLATGLDGLAQGNVPGIAKLVELGGHAVSQALASAVPSQLHAVTVTAGYDIRPPTTRARMSPAASERRHRYAVMPLSRSPPREQATAKPGWPGIAEHYRFAEENPAVSKVLFRKKVKFHVLA